MHERDKYNQMGYLYLYEIIRTRGDIYVCTRQLELDGISVPARDNWNQTRYPYLNEIIKTRRDIYA